MYLNQEGRYGYEKFTKMCSDSEWKFKDEALPLDL
jgi:hypothetical protein